MEFLDGVMHFGPLVSVTFGILALFVGKRLNETIGILREFSMPEPVTGGLLFAIVIGLIHTVSGIAVEFTLGARDVLLVYFFATIGINANLRDLRVGGRPLFILMTIITIFMVLQSFTGLGMARLLGLPPAMGIIGGTVSLIGGHGTAIAWGSHIRETFQIGNATEIGLACATCGLILASISGGPTARFLIKRYQLSPKEKHDPQVGLSEVDPVEQITSHGFLSAVLAIHLAVITGFFLQEILAGLDFQIPLFATCLLMGIFMTAVIPPKAKLLSGSPWPSRSPAMALIADICLGSFLAMSLMNMQLWTLVDLAGPIGAILGAQFILCVLLNIFVVFPAMGKDYDAAVICSGFVGFSLGSTPTAMANMTAVTQRYGASVLAFIVVPLACALFIDLINAVLIPLFLGM